jgi:hypothetical protein
MISLDYYDRSLALIERRTRLNVLVKVLDVFIESWQVGYICADHNRVSDNSEDIIFTGDIPPTRASALSSRRAIVGSLRDVGEDGSALNIDVNSMTPPVSKDEMISFLDKKLNLDKDIINEVASIYDDPGQLDACVSAFSEDRMSSYKEQIDKILSSSIP